MKLTQLRLRTGHGSDELSFSSLNSRLNVFGGSSGVGKTTVANLAAHLLYGKHDASARRNPTAQRQVSEGCADVSSDHGEFTLRCEHDGTQLGRLAVSSGSGSTVDNQTISRLLSGVSPQLLARIYAIQFDRAPQIEDLIGGEFASEFAEQSTHASHSSFDCSEHTRVSSPATIDRRRVDELAHKRDSLARQIEQQIAQRRNDSQAIEQELATLDRSLNDKRTLIEDLDLQLGRVAGELATIQSRLRYFSMESTLRSGPQIDSEEHQRQLAELDAEISRCRQTLSDLQSRDLLVRRDLATVHADGTADNAASLADQRVTVSVLENLLNDLDAETALLARAHEPGRCIAPEAHARLTPVVELLRQQVYTLCGQLTEQERAARRRQLHAESRHLARAQGDLSEQLEHLLERRQTLTHQAQLAGQPVMLLPQAPVDKHCQCEHHREFIGQSDAMLLGSAERSRYEHDATESRETLRRRNEALTAQREALHREISDLQQRWDYLQQQRADLVGRTSVDTLRDELRMVENSLQQAVRERSATPRTRPGAWRASDILSQLTDGRLQQIRIPRKGREIAIIDQRGTSRNVSQLTPSESDQVYLSLVLAAASAHAGRGIRLPLLLDEPFQRQDTAATAAMVGVLEDFARQGHQLLVFTSSDSALRRFESLGVTIRQFSRSQVAKPPVPVEPQFKPQNLAPTPTPAPAVPETTVRVVRESVSSTKDREATPQLRVTGNWARADESQDIYYLTVDASLEDFPVLGPDTQQLFLGLGVHTIAELLDADAEQIASSLGRSNITINTVRLWQTHTSLMCFVPGISLDDAQVLSACGIDSPEEFATVQIDSLESRIREFMASERGRRYAALQGRYTRSSLSSWQSASSRNRSRWQRYSSRWSSRRSASRRSNSGERSRSRSERTPRERKNSTRTTRSSRGESRTERSRQQRERQTSKKHELRFLLERTSEVADAPSIGPKTAERLAGVGIRNVADLLNADATSTANELEVSHIKPDTIATWQHQARLVCCIPELRGYGAQLLVGCGLTEPEQIAHASEDDLFRKIRNYSRSKAGQRILRDGKGPNRDKVAEWIDYAGHMRPLEAA